MRKNLHRSNVVLQPLVKVAGRGGEGRKKWRIVREEKKGKKEEEKDIVATWSGREREKKEENGNTKNLGIPAGIKLRGITRMSAGIVATSSLSFPLPLGPDAFP